MHGGEVGEAGEERGRAKEENGEVNRVWSDEGAGEGEVDAGDLLDMLTGNVDDEEEEEQMEVEQLNLEGAVEE